MSISSFVRLSVSQSVGPSTGNVWESQLMHRCLPVRLNKTNIVQNFQSERILGHLIQMCKYWVSQKKTIRFSKKSSNMDEAQQDKQLLRNFFWETTGTFFSILRHPTFDLLGGSKSLRSTLPVILPCGDIKSQWVVIINVTWYILQDTSDSSKACPRCFNFQAKRRKTEIEDTGINNWKHIKCGWVLFG